MDQRLIVATLAEHTQQFAAIHRVLAGLSIVLEAKLPDLAPEERQILKDNSAVLVKSAKDLEARAAVLKQSVEKLSSSEERN